MTAACGPQRDREYKGTTMNRTEALTEVLRDPARSHAEKEIAARALRSVNASADVGDKEPASASTPYQELSADSLAMLHALGKNHLRDISEDAFALYAHHFDPRFKELLCRQWREWVCPEDYVLALVGMSRSDYWRAVYDHAKSDDVRQNAVIEMQKSRSASS